MKPIYLDITNIPELDHYTGISRVVTEIIMRLLGDRLPLRLLSYSPPKSAYRIIDNERFLLAVKGLLDKREAYTDDYLSIEDFEDGATFLDINSAWHTLPNRSWLLPVLKSKQIRILVQIYDLIPIRCPQYMVGQTLLRFMEYLTAHLTYADAVIVNTHAVEDDVRQLFSELKLPEKPILVMPLGADFTAPENQKRGESADTEVLQKLSGRKFLLTVGTVEPRKNHKLLIDAYEQRLAEMGYDVVIVGRVGWEMDALVNRIRSNPHFGKGLYLLSGVNDATLDALYARAHLVVFASYIEGYGLPTIESLIKGVPVLCSDIPVMREVGGDFADYFDPDDAASLIAAVAKYDDAAIYQTQRDRIRTQYHPPQWQETARVMETILETPQDRGVYPHKPVKQAVFLSARPAPLLATLPYLEAFMPFLTELVVCCPEKMAEYLQRNYQGRMKLTTITDDELLGGEHLPADHSTRNFFLRCLAMEQDAIDDEFIMFDDDYRPLRPLTEEVFYRDGKYRGYYFSDISGWKYRITALFSYDFCHFRTLHFLKSHGYPTLQYSSHQPQLINKVWYREMLAKYPEISRKGYDEWSTYFNYCAAEHRGQYEPLPYAALSWPPVGGESKGVYQPDYLFENFYEDNYAPGSLFAGMSRAFTDRETVLRENEKKCLIAMRSKAFHQSGEALQARCAAEYERKFHEQPQLAVYFGGGETEQPELGVPSELTLSRSKLNALPLGISRAAQTAANILPGLVELHLTDEEISIFGREVFTFEPQLDYTTLTFMLPPELPADVPLFLRVAVSLKGRPERTEKVIPVTLTD